MLGIVCTVKGQVLMRRRCAAREAAAASLRTSSRLVLREVGKTVCHQYSPTVVVFVVEALAQIQGIKRAIYSMGFKRRWSGWRTFRSEWGRR